MMNYLTHHGTLDIGGVGGVTIGTDELKLGS